MSLTQLSQTLSHHLFLDAIQKDIQEKKCSKLSHFVGSSSAFLIHSLAEKQSLLIVTPDFETAQFLEGDLRELGNRKTILFNPTFKKPYSSEQVSDINFLISRSEQLELVTELENAVIITSADALFDFLPAPETFSNASLIISKGEMRAPESITEAILELGYERVNFVSAPGEFSQRGGILDIFPLSTDYPVRLEFFGDEIDSIREFDSDSQRSISFIDKVRFVPNVEQLNEAHSAPFFQFLPDSIPVILNQEELIFAELTSRFGAAQEAFAIAGNPALEAPEAQFCSPELFANWLKDKTIIYDGKTRYETQFANEYTLEARPQPDFNASIKVLRQNLEDLSKQGIETHILTDNEAQKNRFIELLGEPGATLNYQIDFATLHRGFILPMPGIAVYTDHQIFNRYHKPKVKVRQRKTGGLSMKEIRDLNVGDFVVHVDFGIGKFAGFRRIKVKDIEQESVMLKYADDSIMYVNISSLHKLQKYSGKDGMVPQVTKLGSAEWKKKKSRTKSRLKDIARDLIELYAKRKSQKAYSFSKDTPWQTELEASFMFEETPDQMKAIIETKADMEASTPMDRLICGDVGFGKTEVAVRAAFKAVMDGKQVSVLVPTTILADQHYQTFKARMANFPVRIEVMNRFKSAKEQKEIVKKVKEGQVDILIGTHRITSKDIEFKDLGLLIIDEEQRFGVSTKEKLKSLRSTVDVLTLTATPIPRTLHMSLMGARDLSTITTPPPNRQPVLTEIHSFDERIIRDAILAETSRGGQVFFIHNRVQNIGEYTEMLRRIAPNIRARFAHGQMTGTELEQIISDFYEHKFDVLVSTNIVENGIDISNANTIIINHADRFGLSELHQLRGRVGRSNRKAFCLLITPPLQDLSVEARKRLIALEEFSDLGSGFNIAMRDLDIRGAGDVLGAEQSGFINELGYDLYLKILNEAIRELKESEFADQFEHIVLDEELPDTTIEIDLPALLPVSYVSDNVERLNLYRKLANIKKPKEVDEWQNEVIDRFGNLPQEALNLISVAKLKLLAANCFIEKVTIRSGRMWMQLPNPNTDLGIHFFDSGKFQIFLQKIQESTGNRLSVTQKNETVRFVISEINNLNEAIEFLEKYYVEKEEPTFAH